MASSMSADCLISPSPILEHFNCPICLNVMRNIWVTKCFHRYCEVCIKESVNTAHRCPLCNNPLQQEDIQHDAQFSALLETIEKSIEKAEEKKAESFADQIVRQIGDNSIRATLEQLFRETLVSSLADHLKSENEMRNRYNRKKAQIQTAYDQQLKTLQENSSGAQDYKQKLEEKTREYREAIRSLDEEIRNVQKLFIEAYKIHLNEHVSNFAAVPTQVRVTVLKENRLWKLRTNRYLEKLLRPEDRIEILLPALHELAEIQNDKIVELGQMIFFTLIDSLDDQSENKIIERLARANADDENNDLLTVSRDCRPILQHKLLRGTLVVIHGQIRLESEIPKRCFAQVFHEEPTKDHLVDYFTCNSCQRNGVALRWICRSCVSVCHKDHDVTPLVFGNKAAGPKCDCRKVRCRIGARN